MNDVEKDVLRKLHATLVELLEPQWIADSLYSKKGINYDTCEYLKCEDSSMQRADRLLNELPNFCSMEIFIRVLDESDQSHISKIIKESLVLVTPHVVRRNKASYNVKFFRYSKVASELQMKVYQGDQRLENLPNTIEFMCSIDGGRSYYDNLLAFIETQLGRERILNKSKELHNSKLFNFLWQVIPRTSFPDQAELVYQSNFAEALARDGNLDDALLYVENTLKLMDLKTPCRHNCNAIYAVINIQFKLYAVKREYKYKEKILDTIKEAYRQLKNEEDIQTWRLWRTIFLVKEAFCHLALDVNSGDIPDVQVTEQDLDGARRCLDEVRDRLMNGIHKRRELLYYRAEVKYSVQKKDYRTAYEFAKKVLKMANDGKFDAEKFVILAIIDGLKVQLGFQDHGHDMPCVNNDRQINSGLPLPEHANHQLVSENLDATVGEKIGIQETCGDSDEQEGYA